MELKLNLKLNQKQQDLEKFKTMENIFVSIIIAAYKAENFIEECLDSIEQQTHQNYEILLGIDKCHETREKIEQIKHKYKNLRIFWFDKNLGPYIVFNSLIAESQYDIITMFGADDIMKPNHTETNLNLLNDKNFVIAQGQNFEHPHKNTILRTYNPHGIIFLNKKVFLEINGFDEWRCGGDSDLVRRLKRYKLKQVDVQTPTYLRRIHDNCLTIQNKYNHDSEYRKKIRKIFLSRKIIKIPVCKKHKKIELFNTQIKHVIITRCMLEDKDLLKEYLKISKDTLIPALKSQINQNFEWILVTNNEDVEFIKKELDYPFIPFSNNEDVLSYIKNNKIQIQTRHDIDDWMSEKYVYIIQSHYIKNNKKWDRFLIHSQALKEDYYIL